jgi:hypothetical protein
MREPTTSEVSAGGELARDGQPHDAAHVVARAEALEPERELHGHDHADEDGGHARDRDRAHAHLLDLVDQRVELEGPPRDRLDRVP